MSVSPEKHGSVVLVARIAELKVVSAILSTGIVEPLELTQGHAFVGPVFPDKRVIPTMQWPVMIKKAKPRFMVPR
jgi:hypothetical protein